MLSPQTLSIVLLATLMQTPAPAAPRVSAAETIRKLAETHQYDAALAAYDRQVRTSSNTPDPALLAIVARAQLKDVEDGADAGLAADARERLAAAGDQA